MVSKKKNCHAVHRLSVPLLRARTSIMEIISRRFRNGSGDTRRIRYCFEFEKATRRPNRVLCKNAFRTGYGPNTDNVIIYDVVLNDSRVNMSGTRDSADLATKWRETKLVGTTVRFV